MIDREKRGREGDACSLLYSLYALRTKHGVLQGQNPAWAYQGGVFEGTAIPIRKFLKREGIKEKRVHDLRGY